MASRVSLIQSRSIYVGTANNVAPGDGNLIVTGNVGIGATSPAYKLDVDSGGALVAARFYNSSFSATIVYIGDTGNSDYSDLILQSNSGTGEIFKAGTGYSGWGGTLALNIYNSNGAIAFHPNGIANAMFINTSGNVGIKATPSAWASGYSVLNVGDAAAVSWTGAGANDFSFSTNAYYDTTDNRWEYRGTGDGSARYSMTALSYEHRWYNAPVGTANAAISYTQAMTLTGGGNLLIGTTTDNGTKLNVNGVVNASDYYFNGTSSERVVKRYTAGINLAASGYTFIANVTGGSLASAVRMTMQGTSNSVVINVLADIQVNHFQDILITTSSGFYTQVRIRIISNNNDVFSIEAEPVSAIDATTLYVEIFPLNDEVVSFSGSPQTASTLTMTTRQGIYTVGNGGNNGTISAGGDLYVSDNVGIGTTAPTWKLQTESSSSTVAMFRSSDSNTIVGIDNSAVDGDPQLKFYINDIGTFTLGVDDSDSDKFKIGTSDLTTNTRLTIDGSGNVGIGTTAPNSLLHVGASPNFGINNRTAAVYGPADSETIFTISRSGLDYPQMLDFGVNQSGLYSTISARQFTVATENKLVLQPNGGNVGIGTTSPDTPLFVQGGPAGTGSWNRTATLSATYPGLIFNSNGTKWGGMAYDYSAAMRFWVNANNNDIFAGTLALSILNNGNVGIGTTAPYEKLDIVGNIRLGNYTDAGTKYIGYANDTFANQFIAGMSIESTALGGNYSQRLNFATHYYGIYAGVRMTLDEQGRLGIGTTSPGDKLQVDGTIWAKPTSNGTLGTALRLGVFADSASTAAYEFKTNDSTDDFLGLYSNRWGINYEIHRDSSAGDKYVWSVYGDDNGHIMQLYNGSNTNSVRLSSFSSSWLNGGNVGIGTTAPGSKLQVEGANPFIRVNNTSADDHGIKISYNGSDAHGLHLLYNANSAVSYIDNTYQAVSGQVYGNIYIRQNVGGTMTSRITIKADGGNVGIGTTSPSEKLHVDGNVIVTYNNSFQGINSIGNKAILARVSPTTGIINYAEYATATNLNGFVMGSDDARVKGNIATDSLEFITNGSTQVTVLSNGDVGIGTTSPTEKLQVNGSLKLGDGNADGPQLKLASSGYSDWNIDNFSGSLRAYYGSTEYTRLTSSGNFGIGVTPSYKLDVAGDTRITSGSLGVGVLPDATDGRIDASNDIVAYSSSDRRLKENITPIANALDKVKSLTGVEFDWKPEHKKAHGYEGHDTGVIAQEVQEVMPTAVRTNNTGYLAVRYEKLIGLLIEANKELAARVEELEKKLK